MGNANHGGDHPPPPPSPSFLGYAPAPSQAPTQQYEAYPPPQQQQHAYPPPRHPSPYVHGYDPYLSSPGPSSSFQPSAPSSPVALPQLLCALLILCALVSLCALLRLSDRHDVPYGGWLQHGRRARKQVVPYDGEEEHGDSSVKASPKVVLLHGKLHILVYGARNLIKKNKILSRGRTGTYVTVKVSYATVARTYVVPNLKNPVWEQSFKVPVAHEAAEVHFFVKKNNTVGAKIIGEVAIPAEKLLSGDRIFGDYLVLDSKSNGKPCAPGAVLRLFIQFIPVTQLTMYDRGVTAGHGVPHTYFPLRRGMRVTLYQDAHVPEGCLPEILLGNGTSYQHGQCWRDIYFAMLQATKLIYIVGWSVNHTIRLVRDEVELPSLGELLKIKSQEGVQVLLLAWDDPTSKRILGHQTNGIMGTHGKKTRRFFKDSSVQVLLCPRSAGKRQSWMQRKETKLIYTHHQKTVIVDADAGNDRRKIIAFVGGLDLCGGRYDTPWHPLFRSLQTQHKGDYHNPNFSKDDAPGPREPWHDLHSKLDGQAAYDVLQNFQERWLKAAKRHGNKKLAKLFADALLTIEGIAEIIKINDAIYFDDNDPEAWDVQVFRSIDSNSAKGFLKDPREATRKNLVCGKNVLMDMSVHAAYVHAIQTARHFIYIESQYFIGSSFNWDSKNDLGADNLIPIEIALKIANKIKANERFSAYIVIPMWPEGKPTGKAQQRILYWQNKTMQMMYETIYRALEEAELDDIYEPQDYLNFFCLGNREIGDSTSSSNASNAANNPQAQARKNRRFMVYVHSKGMIVDDEYVIIGSANFNQRSMDGKRDTEIAMGAYQPQYTWANKASAPRGQIYGYRMSLWAEHIGGIEEDFKHPESLQCMRRVRKIGEENLQQFLHNDVTEMRGHLMKYPVSVDREGKVNPLPGCTTFPDVGGNICGSFLAIQENLTI